MTAHSATLLNVVAGRADDRVVTRAIRVASVLFITVLTAAAAQISFPLPFTQVPFTFQPLVVLVGGLILGSRLGCASQVLYLSAGIAGLPVFAGGSHGVDYLLGASGGFVLGYVLAAAIVGRLAELGWDRTIFGAIGAMLIGSVAIYAVGLPWLAYVAHFDAATTLEKGFYPYILGDVLKLALAAAAFPAAWWLVGRRPGDR